MNDQFCYVDVAFEKGNKFTKHRRMRFGSDDHVALIKEHREKEFACFETIQRYEVATSHQYGERSLSPLYFDMDGKSALGDAVLLLDYFKEGPAQLSETHMHLSFSGSKGFHLVINPHTLGIMPAPEAVEASLFREVATYLKETLTLNSLDMAVYTPHRLWRIPYSKHQTSGLYKIDLTHADLVLGMEKIRELAVQPLVEEAE